MPREGIMRCSKCGADNRDTFFTGPACVGTLVGLIKKELAGEIASRIGEV